MYAQTNKKVGKMCCGSSTGDTKFVLTPLPTREAPGGDSAKQGHFPHSAQSTAHNGSRGQCWVTTMDMWGPAFVNNNQTPSVSCRDLSSPARSQNPIREQEMR
ncbi:hypothetical protein Ddc_03878 [Ditylenchus destructor]|nr:hypothetical protein Ddc_03878 [Ditylenchus destructor]